MTITRAVRLDKKTLQLYNELVNPTHASPFAGVEKIAENIDESEDGCQNKNTTTSTKFCTQQHGFVQFAHTVVSASPLLNIQVPVRRQCNWGFRPFPLPYYPCHFPYRCPSHRSRHQSLKENYERMGKTSRGDNLFSGQLTLLALVASKRGTIFACITARFLTQVTREFLFRRINSHHRHLRSHRSFHCRSRCFRILRRIRFCRRRSLRCRRVFRPAWSAGTALCICALKRTKHGHQNIPFLLPSSSIS